MRRGVLALCVAAAAGSGAARTGAWSALRDATPARTEVATARIGRSI